MKNKTTKKKQKRGTSPNTSLHLSDAQKAWLRENGGIQPTIRRLIDEAMKTPGN